MQGGRRMIGGWTDRLTIMELQKLDWVDYCQCVKHWECNNEPIYIWNTWFGSEIITCGEEE